MIDHPILDIMKQAACEIRDNPELMIHTYAYPIDSQRLACMMCRNIKAQGCILYTRHRSYEWSLCSDCYLICAGAQEDILDKVMYQRTELLAPHFTAWYGKTPDRCILCSYNYAYMYKGPGMTFICDECKTCGTRWQCAKVWLLLGQLLVSDVRNTVSLLMYDVILAGEQ